MKKILLARFRHETNSFSPLSANMQAYQNFSLHVGEECFAYHRGVETEIGAFLDVFAPREDIELIPSVTMSAVPSGPVTKEVYDFATQEICAAIRRHMPLDGILMDCHGAMVAEGHCDGEGDLFEAIRALVGEEIPLIASLDLHANVTAKMARYATALVPYNTYPHIDIYETGCVAARIMEETLDGSLTPVMAYRRVPYLLPLFPSDSERMKPLYRLAEQLEAREGVRSVRFAHGFFPADIAEMGISVMVVANGDRDLAERVADEMERAIVQAIPQLVAEYIPVEEALDKALSHANGPVVLADASDNPGAGGVGDSTHILRRILERGITGAAIATIFDPAAVEACAKAGVGATLSLKLGGWSDPLFSGGPLEVTAYVRALTDGNYILKGKMLHGTLAKQGKTAVVEIAGNTVLINSVSRQPFDLEVFRSHGIAPEEQRILVTKSAIHYRASFGSVASEMLTVAAPGYAVPVPDGLPYKNWKGPSA